MLPFCAKDQSYNQLKFKNNRAAVTQQISILEASDCCYLTLVLHLLSWSADNIDLGGQEANGGVDRDVFAGSIANVNLHLSLKSVKRHFKKHKDTHSYRKAPHSSY